MGQVGPNNGALDTLPCQHRIDADREKQETGNRQDLNTGEPELHFSVDVDRQKIKRGDHNPEDGSSTADK